METIGWIGAMLFALCGLPEAWRSWRRKRCDVGWAFLSMWLGGEALTLFYVVAKEGLINLMPLIVNYLLNIVFILIMCYYKWKCWNARDGYEDASIRGGRDETIT